NPSGGQDGSSAHGGFSQVFLSQVLLPQPFRPRAVSAAARVMDLTHPRILLHLCNRDTDGLGVKRPALRMAACATPRSSAIASCAGSAPAAAARSPLKTNLSRSQQRSAPPVTRRAPRIERRHCGVCPEAGMD